MTLEFIDRVRDVARHEAGWVVALLQDLVRIPSVNGALEDGHGEEAAQRKLQSVLERLGCRITMWEPDAEAVLQRFPAAAPSVRTREFAGRPNLVAVLPGSASGPEDLRSGVILNSHVDTVGPGDPGRWRHDPFGGELVDGQVHGLGAVDAKGCVVTFVGALHLLECAGIRLRGSVAIQAVADEEWGGVGTLACLERGYTAPLAIVGEPTNLRVCPGSRGSYGANLTIHGRKAHPGSPWDGVNAIDKALVVVEHLRHRQRELDRTHMHPLWSGLPVGHVWNLMEITATGGRAIPDRCEMHFGAGSLGDESFDFIRAQVEQAIEDARASDDWLMQHPPELAWRELQLDAAVTDGDHPAVRTFVASGEAAGEEVSTPIAFSAGSDGRHLRNLGGIPAINFGPGSIGVCHAPNEALSVAELQRATVWIAAFLIEYLGADGER